METNKNKIKREQLWDREAADACLHKQLIQNEQKEKKNILSLVK